MLYFDLIDILFFLVGILIGVGIMACVYPELLEMMEDSDEK